MPSNPKTPGSGLTQIVTPSSFVWSCFPACFSSLTHPHPSHTLTEANFIIMRASIRSPWLKKARQPSSSRIASPQLTPFRAFHPPRLSFTASLLPRRLLRQQPLQAVTLSRHNASLAPKTSSSSPSSASASPSPTATHPAYEIYFTCKPCSHRSGPHRVTKQGFHKGTTLITCPSCKNRHVVSDHLRIFTDKGGDLVEILRRHGEKLKKGKLGIRNGELVGNEGEEEIEFWEDGSETPHISQEPKSTQ